jgi:hypothetical protein
MEKVRQRRLVDHPANHNWLEDSDEEELFGPRGRPRYSAEEEPVQHSLHHSVVASRPDSQASSTGAGKRPMTYTPARSQMGPSQPEFKAYLPRREFPSTSVPSRDSPRIPSFDFHNEPNPVPDLEIPRPVLQTSLRSSIATDIGQDLELQEKATFRVPTRVMDNTAPSPKTSKRTSRVATNLRGPPTRFGAHDPFARDQSRSGSRVGSRVGSRQGSPAGSRGDSRGSSPSPYRAPWANRKLSQSAENLHLSVALDNSRPISEQSRMKPPVSPITGAFQRTPSALSQITTNADLKRRSLRGSTSTPLLRQEAQRAAAFPVETEGGLIVPMEHNPHGGARSFKGSIHSRPSTADSEKPQIPTLKFSGPHESHDTESFMYQKYAEGELDRPDSAFDLPGEYLYKVVNHSRLMPCRT